MRAQMGPQIGRIDQPPQRRRNPIRILGGRANSARFVNDFLGPAHGCGDHRQSGGERFDEHDSKWLGAQIRLAENIGRRQQTGDIGALSEKADPVGPAMR